MRPLRAAPVLHSGVHAREAFHSARQGGRPSAFQGKQAQAEDETCRGLREMRPEEKFYETDAIFQVLVECCDRGKIDATDDGKPLLPLLWKCARELTR